MQTISAKWDSEIFQLWEKVKNKSVKVKGQAQEDYFNNCWLFNNSNNCVYYEHRTSTGWNAPFYYQKIVTIKEVLGEKTNNIYDNLKKLMIVIYT